MRRRNMVGTVHLKRNNKNNNIQEKLAKNIEYTEKGADTHTNARTKHTENSQTPDPDRWAEHVRCEQVIGPDRHPGEHLL